MVEIIWTETANSDLIEIKEFIEVHSSLQAVLFLEGIYTKAQILIQFPEIGKKLKEFPNLPYRELLYKKYRIIYRIEENKVIIAAVYHSSRLLGNHPFFEDLY